LREEKKRRIEKVFQKRADHKTIRHSPELCFFPRFDPSRGGLSDGPEELFLP
jgi:hypothetical protein